MNNKIGRQIGAARPGETDLRVHATAVLKEFHDVGLSTATAQTGGGYKIAKTRLTDSEYAEASWKLATLDELGYDPTEQAARKAGTLK